MIIEDEIDKITTDWKPVLKSSLSNINSCMFINDINPIYPPRDKIFSCFNAFNISDLKVVIIGQDPYHQPNQANGLCFSVENGIKPPPSLKNIFREIHSDIYSSEGEFNIEQWNTDLTRWALQGVLLLNNTLTVSHGKPNSHVTHWKGFVSNIIKYITEHCNEIVFLLWGKNAQLIKKYISKEVIHNHFFLECGHPSPLSANRGCWFGNKHFSKTNKLLNNCGKDSIIWN